MDSYSLCDSNLLKSVSVMQVDTEHSLRALKGDVNTSTDDWLGTGRLSEKKNTDNRAQPTQVIIYGIWLFIYTTNS